MPQRHWCCDPEWNYFQRPSDSLKWGQSTAFLNPSAPYWPRCSMCFRRPLNWVSMMPRGPQPTGCKYYAAESIIYILYICTRYIYADPINIYICSRLVANLVAICCLQGILRVLIQPWSINDSRDTYQWYSRVYQWYSNSMNKRVIQAFEGLLELMQYLMR